MKTLADLKRQAKNYEWSMLSNSWFKTVPDFLVRFRKVEQTGSRDITFETIKNGVKTYSGTAWPKAKLLEITQHEAIEGGFYVTFHGETEKDCTLKYLLVIGE